MKTLEMWKRLVAKVTSKQLRLIPLGLLHRRTSETPKPSKKQQVQLWASSISVLLGSEQGIALFRSFLEQEFSEENLDFWLAVEQYRQAKPLNMTSSANEIYDEYVAPTASRQVNLDAATRAAVKEALSRPTVELFDAAQRRIQILMQNDTYGRFLNSAPYLALLGGKRRGIGS